MYPGGRAPETGRSSVAAACSFDERVAVCTLGNRGVILVSSDRNAIETAVILGHHIVLAL